MLAIWEAGGLARDKDARCELLDKVDEAVRAGDHLEHGNVLDQLPVEGDV